MLIALKLAFKLLKKEWRSWVWYILLTATAISIAAVTALNFYTSQVQFTLQQQGARILGGDLVLVSSTPIPPFWVEQANKMGLKTAQSWSYPSMASIDSRFQLINIQAVSANFPLIGTENARPAIGSIWVEPRLLSLLAIKSTDSLSIGEKSLPIAKTITGDIQVLNTGWLMAPRVLMRIEDIPATKTILPGSRIEYRLLLTGDAI